MSDEDDDDEDDEEDEDEEEDETLETYGASKFVSQRKSIAAANGARQQSIEQAEQNKRLGSAGLGGDEPHSEIDEY